jgi:SAM-dependent methyltransferase
MPRPRISIRDGSADLVVSLAVVEHIHDNAVFFRNCAYVLRPGGVMIHVFSGRFAPFALMNQLLPNPISGNNGVLARALTPADDGIWSRLCRSLR